MSVTTRRPTGKPSWPIMLIAGAEKTGKTWSAATATTSPHIGRTFWIGVGEDDPDEYGAIPGADFEIVSHDGTYRGILAAITACVREPRVDGRPTLLVVDSMSRLWHLLGDMAQAEADKRARRKGATGDGSADIAMDLWNAAAQRWAHVMDVLRAHDGPVILTARLDVVTVVDGAGKPTKAKDRKVVAHKTLPYDAGVIVELDGVGDAYVTGVRSLRFRPERERTPVPDFSVEGLWDRLGCLDGDEPPQRSHQSVSAHTDWQMAIDAATSLDDVRSLWKEAAANGALPGIQDALLARKAELEVGAA